MNSYFFTIIDSFLRYGQAYQIPTLSPINTTDNLQIFISHQGLPLKITTDNGGKFKNKCLEEFCKLHKIELHFTTPKNSNSNCPIERFHSTIAEEIGCLKIAKPQDNINNLMTYALIGYNNAIHSSTGFTPFEIVNGHINPNNPFDLTDTQILSSYMQKHRATLTSYMTR